MDEHHVEEVKTAAAEFQKAIGDDYKWEWDDRFKGALTQFAKSNEPFVLTTLSQFFPSEWTVTNIENAPEAVLIAADFLGGLRSDQRLFTTNPENDPMCVVAYWPWGNGTTISIRLIPTSQTASPSDLEPVVQEFQTALNL